MDTNSPIPLISHDPQGHEPRVNALSHVPFVMERMELAAPAMDNSKWIRNSHPASIRETRENRGLPSRPIAGAARFLNATTEEENDPKQKRLPQSFGQHETRWRNLPCEELLELVYPTKSIHWFLPDLIRIAVAGVQRPPHENMNCKRIICNIFWPGECEQRESSVKEGTLMAGGMSAEFAAIS